MPSMHKSKIPVRVMITTYISFGLITAIGYIRDILSKILRIRYKSSDKMVPIFSSFESFYSRNIFLRFSNYFSMPIHGVPGRIIKVYKNNTYIPKNDSIENDFESLLNLGSYNYLGFAKNKGNIIKSVLKSLNDHPINLSSPTRDVGSFSIVHTLEKEMADFLFQEDCVVFSMGYGTNSSNIPVMFDSGTLVFSDEKNHASLITGLKLSKATIKVFKHNDMEDLEKRLVFSITQGQPLTHKYWKKVIVMVEGIYSMEGSILNLKRLIELKKKYKFYIFIDEAHSIGALGCSGRGICDHHNVDYKDIDILMGTFTKSFGGMGGYIAGKKGLITYLRFYSDFSLYGEQMPPVVASQILGSLRRIRDTKKGKIILKRLKNNTNLMRDGLEKMGFCILGDKGSPVIPIVIPNPGKIKEFARICREEGIATVVVGYPATSLLFGRIRLCMSSSHKKKDIIKSLEVFSKLGDLLGLKYCK